MAASLSASASSEKADCGKKFREMLVKQQSEDALLSMDAEKLDEIVLQEFKANYFDNWRRTSPEKADRWNSQLVKSLEDLPIRDKIRDRKGWLPMEEMYKLYRQATSNPVALYRCVKKYDPKGGIGFCFGRGFNAHLTALRFGVSKDSVKKIWAVGSMKYENINWGHHIATMVRGPEGKWYVLDPEYNKVLELTYWMKTVKKMDNDGKLTFFASDPSRWSPSYARGNADPRLLKAEPDELFGMWAKQEDGTEIRSGNYQDYFNDLMRVSRAEARDIIEQRKNAENLLGVKEFPKSGDRQIPVPKSSKERLQAMPPAEPMVKRHGGQLEKPKPNPLPEPEKQSKQLLEELQEQEN